MSKIKDVFVVTKRNVLNEIKVNSMSLQELRFFSIYLSRINPSDVGTRIVRFPLEDFKTVMELGRINIEHMKTVTNSLLAKVVNVPNDSGGYTGFQLFKQCVVDIDKKGEWYVEIDAHDRALPLMFEFKDRYFSYKLWNALRLKSANQLRMYEILKQYERVGERVIHVSELRNLLGIEQNEYPRYGDFKRWVLEACRTALAGNTDISFTYEPYGKKGQGGKIIQLKFNIEKNESYVDPISLAEFLEKGKSQVIEMQDETDEENCSNP
ncbi:MAG: replication initiation protein [Defluviitaleaceae bacterium]|nr:replication initiation protein [Defluviitaleaceae bacterium]